MSYESKIYCKLQEVLAELQSPKRDSEVTCVEENANLYILQFSTEDQTYHVYDFSWHDVTWTVTPVKCDADVSLPVNTNGTLVSDSSTFTFPANVVSFAISAQSGNFDLSFDNGVTYPITAREGVREFGDWTTIITNSNLIKVLSHGDIDIIRETI